MIESNESSPVTLTQDDTAKAIAEKAYAAGVAADKAAKALAATIEPVTIEASSDDDAHEDQDDTDDDAKIEAIYTQSAAVARKLYRAMNEASVRDLDVAGSTLHAREPRTNVGSYDRLTIDDDSANLLVTEPGVERYVHRDFHHLETSPELETIESFMEIAPAAFKALHARIDTVAEVTRKAVADIEAMS